MNAKILATIRAISGYYSKPGNSVGGNLHVVLDDGNVFYDDIQFCRKQALDRGDTDGVKLTDMLLDLTLNEREDAVDGYWNLPKDIDLKDMPK